MDTSNPAWLPSDKPYYVPPAPVFVYVPQTGNYPPGRQETAESAMQDNTQMLLNWPSGFVFGGAGSGNRTPSQLFDDLLTLAKSLTQSPYAALTCVGFDPTVSAAYHANLVFDTLKRIPASRWLPYNLTDSVFDVWTAPKAAPPVTA